MKRITQFFLIVLVLMAANLAAAPHKAQKGGSLIYSKAVGNGFYCYDDPETTYDCGTVSTCACKAACEYECGGSCDWNDPCPAT